MIYSHSAINSLIDEHQAMRAHLELVINLTQEWKNNLASPEFNPSDPEKLRQIAEKHAGLGQAMNYLKDGLKAHHIHEEEVMPPLIGDLLTQAIRLEHNEMDKLMGKIDLLILGTSLEAFLEKALDTLQLIENLCGLARNHSSREDGILHFLKILPEQAR